MGELHDGRDVIVRQAIARVVLPEETPADDLEHLATLAIGSHELGS